MRIRILGAGWYGCHIASALLRDRHDVEVFERGPRIFAGASGGIPARLHEGFHYPRSKATRDACQSHRAEFLAAYGHLTHGVPVNVYAVALHDSLVDFGTFLEVMRGTAPHVPVARPDELGLVHVEGAVLTGERHIVTDAARAHFARLLGDRVQYGVDPGDESRFDWTIDCTFCANGAANVDRYEPCVTGILEGPVDRAVTIMDGPFPSLYPWDEAHGLLSLTSASLTPLARCKSRGEAEAVLASTSARDAKARVERMIEQLAEFYPRVRDECSIVCAMTSIRAMPRSGAATRLVEVSQAGESLLRVRAGKIDAIFEAERQVRRFLA